MTSNHQRNISLPLKYRSIEPIYTTAIDYYDLYKTGKALTLKQLAKALICVESCFEIIHEFKMFDNHNSLEVANESRNERAVIVEQLMPVLNMVREYKAFINPDDFKKYTDECKENMRYDIILAMAVYYRDKGEKELKFEQEQTSTSQNNNELSKAGQYLHCAAIYFHCLILQSYEASRCELLDINSASSKHYQRLLINFNICREKLKLCSKNLQQNLKGEHFWIPNIQLLPECEVCNVDTSTTSTRTTKNVPRLLSHYEIRDKGKIGEGGYGTVFIVKHKVSQVEFACKKISTSNMDFKMLGRLHREIAILKQVDYPNAVMLHEVYYDSNCVYVVMELCKVGDMSCFMRDVIHRQFYESEAKKLLVDIIIAIRYLHEHKILHCDIKLENFILDANDSSYINALKNSTVMALRKTLNISEFVVKITDFGLSKYSDDYVDPILSGSLPYIPPEVFNKQGFSEKSDIWAIGVSIFAMLTMSLPFAGKTPQELITNINKPVVYPKYLSRSAVDFIKQFLEIDPANRISLKAALEHPFLVPNSTPSLVSSNLIDRTAFSTSDQPISGRVFSFDLPSMDSASAPELSSQQSGEWLNIAQSLQSYWSMCKFNKVLCKAVAFSLNPRQISDLRTIFTNLDKDRNGRVSIDELKEVLRSKCPECASDIENSEAFQDLANSNMEFSYSDFIAAALTKRICVTESQLLTTFEVLDQNGDGFLSNDAVRQSTGDYLTAGEVQEMILTLDKNGDGKIDYHEFIHHWRKISHQHHDSTPKTKYTGLFRKAFNLAKAVNLFSKKSTDKSNSSTDVDDMSSTLPNLSSTSFEISNSFNVQTTMLSTALSSRRGPLTSETQMLNRFHHIECLSLDILGDVEETSKTSSDHSFAQPTKKLKLNVSFA